MQEKPKVLLVGKVRERIAERLEDEAEVVRCVAPLVPGALGPVLAAGIRGVAVSNNFGAPAIGCLPNLEIIANFGVGYDGIAVEAAAARGIVVTNTPDVLNDEVADSAIGLLLNTLRRFPEAEAWLRDGRWERTGAFPLSPLTLRGRSIGIYGLGRIGLAIARRLEGFGVSISYHTRTGKPDAPYVYHPTLLGMAEAVDTLIAIVPKTPDTYKTIDATVLSALGPNGVLINVGRGWTVDEDALARALATGTIAAAGLDVFQDEPHVPEALLAAPNTCLLPHVASASVATRDAMADLVADNLLAWFRTGSPLTPVPETPVMRS
ncbi:2-hydroxyacid dehydrogenase [Mycoplana dimorpha]|uniref:Lactate dehydrogenase-like 2-hydroxyacid dehydrogenase n=1 Tax=Mycoplana dimorpha TaxID=28320 RepID=A0A2T5B5R1_MYCDI|nr:2-hydroxyacid dehydrogenase [Mycoplana dimorpha]PTM94290.1 lactate dehydrogenase-like 2-hydroxyacid dehydrogenase [Mycoplana dimorpha]